MEPAPLWAVILCAVGVLGLVAHSLAPRVRRHLARRRWPLECEYRPCPHCHAVVPLLWDEGVAAQDYAHDCGARGAITRKPVGVGR